IFSNFNDFTEDIKEMNTTALDQYEEIVTDALKSCSAKLRKSFKTGQFKTSVEIQS
ncbi:hypothetical protein EVA_21057, partial [gut metagenome]